MNFEIILQETKKDFKVEKHCRGLDLSDPYFDVMDKHYKTINNYISATISGKKEAERGKLLGNLNNDLKSIIDNEDLMMFILENLPAEFNNIDEF